MRYTLLLLLFACDPDEVSPSTQVGNPGRVAAVLGTSDGQLASASAEIESWSLLGCGGSTSLLVEDVTLNLLEPMTLALPLGETCGTLLRFAGPLMAEGVMEGTPFRVEVEPNVIQVKLASPLATADQAVFLELGGADWLTVGDLDGGVVDEDGVTVLGNQGGIRGRLQSATRLYVDLDGNGVLTDDERLPNE